MPNKKNQKIYLLLLASHGRMVGIKNGWSPLVMTTEGGQFLPDYRADGRIINNRTMPKNREKQSGRGGQKGGRGKEIGEDGRGRGKRGWEVEERIKRKEKIRKKNEERKKKKSKKSRRKEHVKKGWIKRRREKRMKKVEVKRKAKRKGKRGTSSFFL